MFHSLSGIVWQRNVTFKTTRSVNLYACRWSMCMWSSSHSYRIDGSSEIHLWQKKNCCSWFHYYVRSTHRQEKLTANKMLYSRQCQMPTHFFMHSQFSFVMLDAPLCLSKPFILYRDAIHSTLAIFRFKKKKKISNAHTQIHTQFNGTLYRMNFTLYLTISFLSILSASDLYHWTWHATER